MRRTASEQERRGPGAGDVSGVAGERGTWPGIIVWNPLPALMKSSPRAVFARVAAEKPRSPARVRAALNDRDVQKRPPVAGGGEGG